MVTGSQCRGWSGPSKELYDGVFPKKEAIVFKIPSDV